MLAGIYAKTKADEVDGLLIVLEPANVEKLRMGQPLVARLRDFWPQAPIDLDLEITVCWTPDPEWVCDRVRDGMPLPMALDRSLSRDEVFLREQGPRRKVL